VIEYDYVFKRNEGIGIREYKPSFDRGFPNIVQLKGRNSCGKSTLMNLIALSFYGLDSNYVSDSLKKKLEYISKSERIDVDFDIVLSNNSGHILKSSITFHNYIN
jgi:exonuclease SbcC